MSNKQRDTEDMLDDLLFILKDEGEDSAEDFKKPTKPFPKKKEVSILWKCNVCFNFYDTASNLAKHKQFKHSAEVKPKTHAVVSKDKKLYYKEVSSCACKICGKIFNHSFLKEIHQCTGVIELISTRCSVCGLRFLSQDSFKFHRFLAHEMSVEFIGIEN